MGGTPTYYQNYQQHKNLQTVKTQPQLSEERGQLVYIEDEKNDAYKAGIKKLGNIGSSEPFGVHSMQDVPVFAVGPGSEKIGRVFDNNELFFVIADAFGLGSTMKYNDKKTNGMRNSKKTKKIKDDYPDYKIERHMHGKYDRMDEL